MHSRGHYIHSDVTGNVTLGQWADKIKMNFESHFFVTRAGNVNQEYINKEGIYKDTLNSRTPWADYQLRQAIYHFESVCGRRQDQFYVFSRQMQLSYCDGGGP